MFNLISRSFACINGVLDPISRLFCSLLHAISLKSLWKYNIHCCWEWMNNNSFIVKINALFKMLTIIFHWIDICILNMKTWKQFYWVFHLFLSPLYTTPSIGTGECPILVAGGRECYSLFCFVLKNQIFHSKMLNLGKMIVFS